MDANEKSATEQQQTTKCADIAVHTSQEIDAIGRATASGKTLAGYWVDYDVIRFSTPAIQHTVEIRLTEDERRGGMDSSHLEAFAREQDSDAVLAQLYILSALAPPPPAPKQAIYTGWIQFDDVIDKIGWSPRSTAERREMHARIASFLRFGERAMIVGERTTPYVNRKTKTKFDTQVSHPLWRVTEQREPAQGTLDETASEADRAPVAVKVAITEKIAELITSPITAQFLPMGEVLGAIPPGRASGAWARVIGLALMSFWRRNPEKSLNGYYQPTRRELLTHFPPKVAPLNEVLASQNNARAIEYWHDALRALVECSILADEGETLLKAKEVRAALPLRDWQRDWLDGRVVLMPGEEMKTHVVARALMR